MLEQTRKLYEIFNEEQKNKINLIIREIENQGSNYKTNKLWTFINLTLLVLFKYNLIAASK